MLQGSVIPSACDKGGRVTKGDAIPSQSDFSSSDLYLTALLMLEQGSSDKTFEFYYCKSAYRRIYVEVPTMTATTTTTEAPKEAEPAESITESSSSSIASTSSEEATTALDSATEATPAHDHAEGPKPEEEAEADRARAALFPDEQEE